MPAFDASKGQRVDILVRGYVTYNTGGYINISDKPLDEDGEPETGCARLDIPEWMVVGEPRPAPLYEDGALFLVTPKSDERSSVLWRYDAATRKMVRITGAHLVLEDLDEETWQKVERDRTSTVTRLYPEGEV